MTRKPIATILTLAALLAIAGCSTNQTRLAGAGAGAAAGAVVAGPVGAAAGGVIGAISAPTIARKTR